MRKKLIALLAVMAVMAVVLSVTAFAADGVVMTNHGILTAMFERLTIATKAFFDTIDAIYLFFKGIFG